ncbi:MAG: hypothetical protein IKE91_06270 [Clostridia bacterium]|nr:hypothetical protein [Clostridia bacterium]
MNEEIKEKTETLQPFTKLCMTIGQLPTSYLMSMTYYEQLIWLTKYLQDKVIPAVNQNAAAVEELQGLFVDLQDYVNHYFDNLNVQQEINNKLDEMAESGQLTDIIAQYLGLAGMITFNNVAEMKAANNLVNGSKCCTLGYYSANDGGKALYKIRTITNDDVIDESTIIAVYDNTLIAELILEDSMAPEQFGCYGDGTHDDTTKFQIALNKQVNLELKNGKTYLLTTNIDLPQYTHINGNGATIKYDYNGTREHQIRNANWLNNDNILNTIYLDNINFYVNSTTRQIKLIGLTDYENVIIQNCNYSNNSSLSYGSWLLDLYSNCSNVLIDNINVETLTNNESLMNTCIGIREYRSGLISENIKVINSKFIHNGIDETIWIDSWNGIIKNVICDNCIIHDKSTTDVTMGWVGSDNSYAATSYFENCLINNCIFIKDELDYAGFKFGHIGNESENDCFNFILQNSKFIVKSGTGATLFSGPYNEASIRNCEFELNVGSTNYGYIMSGSFKNYNNVFNIISSTDISSSSTAFWNVKEMYDCIVNAKGGIMFNPTLTKLYNTIINNAYYLLKAQSVTTDFNIDISNCNIEVTDYFIERSSVSGNSTIVVKNCNIRQSTKAVFHLYSVTGTNNTQIINTNFENDTLSLTNTGNEYLTISNCTHKSKLISGIPASGVRGACVIGTVFDGGQGHSIVRKISAGNDTTNWETI